MLQRVRLPLDFADALLELPPDLRSRALWLALNPRVAKSFEFQKLIACEEQARQAGRTLNQALRRAGKEKDLSELAPAVLEVLTVLGTIQNPESKSEGGVS